MQNGSVLPVLFYVYPADNRKPGNDTHEGVLHIDKQKTRKVSRVQYGFHYEEIGMIGEGALHAELVRNRSFEEATPPADLAVKNGLYQNVPNPRGKTKMYFM